MHASGKAAIPRHWSLNVLSFSSETTVSKTLQPLEKCEFFTPFQQVNLENPEQGMTNCVLQRNLSNNDLFEKGNRIQKT